MEQKVFGLDFTDEGIKITSGRVKSFYTHTHMYNEMLLYEPFDGYLTVNNEIVTVDTETLLLVTTTDFHSTTVDGKTNACYLKIAFRDDVVSPHILPKLAQPIVSKKYSSNALLTELINRLRTEVGNIDNLKIILNALLLELCSIGSKIGSASKKGTELLLLNALNTVNEHFFESISLQSVAEELSVTPQYLSSAFSKYMGVSFSEYLRDKRLKFAANQLSTQKYNVTEVCFNCGYDNLSHFIRSFKKKFGISPKTYAKQHDK